MQLRSLWRTGDWRGMLLLRELLILSEMNVNEQFLIYAVNVVLRVCEFVWDECLVVSWQASYFKLSSDDMVCDIWFVGFPLKDAHGQCFET